MGDAKNTGRADSIRRKIMAQAGVDLAPVYESDSLTKAGKAIGGMLKSSGGDKFDRYEPSYQMQRSMEREDMSQYMKNGLSGSKTFTSGEIRRGYRKLD